MSLRPAHLAALSLLLAACGEDVVAPESFAAACPLREPVRLAAPPAGWQPGPARVYPFKQLGDHLLYSFDNAGDPDPGYWLVHRCGGPPKRFTTFTPGTVLPFALSTAEGTLVYAVDREGRHVVLDRLDVPGFDVPRPIDGLSRYDVPGGSPHEAGYALFASVNRPTGDARQAAGVDGGSAVVHTHDGDPEAPALHLGDHVVSLAQHGSAVFVLDDDGALRKVDPFTRESEPLQDGVRYFTLAADGRHLIWQAIGDDDVEPVYLRDLEASARLAVADFGVDREIAVNDFAARSWNRMPAHGLAVGRWTWTEASAAAALVGPDDTFVTAVRTDTGESLAIPEHRQQRGALGDDFVLVMPDPNNLVLALWSPEDGDVRVWYRGPADATVEARARRRRARVLPRRADRRDHRQPPARRPAHRRAHRAGPADRPRLPPARRPPLLHRRPRRAGAGRRPGQVDLRPAGVRRRIPRLLHRRRARRRLRPRPRPGRPLPRQPRRRARPVGRTLTSR
ncbi:hypothetical protein OV079_46590 [Nannocystis pusilla]|uniref:Lipoprotein n=1 Tax=Nannocystis pusilla TaxID=889268 RepID=A0A9X3F0C8_9BACT|nr:hypothetical protein [Nannocystis pusilla]MCY1012885.1 hypothetical protein [Nannocystis pusilla]